MKILVDGLPRTVGGIGTLIMNIVNKSRALGADIEYEFLMPSGSRYIDILTEKGEKFYLVPPVSKTKEYKAYLTRLFSENHYDFLWFNNTSKVNIYLPRIAKKVGHCKVITHIHGSSIEASGKRKVVMTVLDKLNAPEMYRLIDIPLACSNVSARNYYRNKKLLDRTTIIYNGIETDKYTFNDDDRNAVRNELNIEDSDVLLGTVGRLTAIKNYPFIINMMKDLPSNYKLIIAGIGEDEKLLDSIIRDNDLSSRCSLLGIRNDIPQLLSAMDVFLLPSFSEGMPFSIIEAQASGLPCIMSDTLSDELDITGLVKALPISGETKVWADKISESDIGKSGRLEYSSKVKQAGYDIDVACRQFIDILNKA